MVLVTELPGTKNTADIASRNPLDESENFKLLCEACRRGDVKTVQSLIECKGVNVNAVDRFDYPPLTLASLCGHFDVVQLLLESGAICERDTFQGERCLYNALNNRIRNLLLQYDYSKSIDPAQPWASHIASLLNHTLLDTTDVNIIATSVSSSHLKEFRFHKFLLAARSSYFRQKLQDDPAAAKSEGVKKQVFKNIRLSSSVDARAFETAAKFMYLGEVVEVFSQEMFEDIEKISRLLDLPDLWELVSVASDPKQRRLKRSQSVEKAQDDINSWFKEFVVGRKILVEKDKANDVRIFKNNDTFADVILRADEEEELPNGGRRLGGPRAVLYPVHKAMLRSEFFTTMFTSSFREGIQASEDEPLHIIPLEMTPETLEIVLQFLYSEKAEVSLESALDVLFAADQLLIDRLKSKAAQVMSTAGNTDDLPLSIYDVVQAGWLTRVRRLEEFGAKYIAERLEYYIEDEEFAELVSESAHKIKHRQETDTIELIDDIRYYLSERFRMRMDNLETGVIFDQNAGTNGDEISAVVKEAEKKLSGEITEEDDESTQESLEYDALLNQIDVLLDRLKLDA
ncbi:hypothetical protein RUND412_006687 [Rhizina undulata]